MNAKPEAVPGYSLRYFLYGEVRVVPHETESSMTAAALEMLDSKSGIPISGSLNGHPLLDQEDFFNLWVKAKSNGA